LEIRIYRLVTVIPIWTYAFLIWILRNELASFWSGYWAIWIIIPHVHVFKSLTEVRLHISVITFTGTLSNYKWLEMNWVRSGRLCQPSAKMFNYSLKSLMFKIIHFGICFSYNWQSPKFFRCWRQFNFSF
jgi:hypothetical protein